MSRVGDYLRIPEGYAAALGGLRWAPDGDAVEQPDGGTFALPVEIISFLEGFCSQKPLAHFAHALHLLHLLRHGDWPTYRQEFGLLHRAYREAGSPSRT